MHISGRWRVKFILLLSLLNLGWLAGCPGPDGAVDERRISYQLGSADITHEVAAACNTDLQKIARGYSADTDKAISSIIAGADDKSLCASWLADLFEERLKNGSVIHDAMETDAEEMEFDLLIVGSGLHGAILARNLSLRKPDLRILLIDNKNHPAEHFRTNRYRINSPSSVSVNANNLPNTPVSIREHTDPKPQTPSVFPIARQLWNQIIFNIYSSNALTVFNAEVEEISKDGDVYRVKIRGPHYFTKRPRVVVKKIVISSGLGQEILPKTDDKQWLKEQRELASSFSAREFGRFPQFLTYEELIRLSDRLAGRVPGIFDFIGKKDIAVIGAGDSGKIMMELLTQHATTNQDFFYSTPKSIYWFGQRYQTFNEFVDASDTKPRYKQSGFDAIYGGLTSGGTSFVFRPIPEQVTAIAPRNDKVEVTSKGGQRYSVDLVISAMGYDNRVDDFLTHTAVFLGQKPRYEVISNTVFGDTRFSTSIENVATRVCPASKTCEDIFVIGTAAGEALKVSQGRYDESLTKNPASIETLAPLTESFSHYLF